MDREWFSPFMTLSQGVFVALDSDMKVIWCSEGVFSRFGYHAHELVGQSLDVIAPARYRPKLKQRLSELLLLDGDIDSETLKRDAVCIHKTGHEVLVNVNMNRCVRDGRIWVLLSMKEIEERYSAGNLLLQSQEVLKNSQAIGHIGSWAWTADRNTIEWSDETYRILGHLNESHDGSLKALATHIHPADYRRFRDKAAKCRKLLENFEIEHRIKRRDGATRYVITRVKFFGRNGKPQEVRGTIQDITEYREQQERIELNRIVMDHIADGYIVADSETQIVDMNHVIADITGLERGDIVGRSTSRFLHPDSPNTGSSIIPAFFEGSSWSGEVWLNSTKKHHVSVLANIVKVKYSEEESDKKYVITVTDISAIKEGEERLRHQALYDSLTGLPNRKHYMDHLKLEITKARSGGDRFAVFYLDLDGFKSVNDTQGHDSGDKLLIDAAKRLCSVEKETLFAARLGGDEFALILTGNPTEEQISQVAEAINHAMSFTVRYADWEMHLTVSIGVSVYPDDGGEHIELLRKADQAMYQAKSLGKNNYSLFDQSLAEKAKQEIQLISDLKQALEFDQFYVLYQPQFSLSDSRLSGAEALLRWRHPDRGLVAPDIFIPLAERSGVIGQIGIFVLEQACQLLLEHGDTVPKVSVNMSSKQLRSPHLIAEVSELLERYRIEPRQLEIEITETAAMEDIDFSLDFLNQIKALGVSIAVDDFGTGYSSLSYLKQLPLTKLKIDKSFIQKMTPESDDQAIVGAVISMAKVLGLDVVAEGVETPQQLEILKSLECNEVQGYLLGRPMAQSELLRLSDSEYAVE